MSTLKKKKLTLLVCFRKHAHSKIICIHSLFGMHKRSSGTYCKWLLSELPVHSTMQYGQFTDSSSKTALASRNSTTWQSNPGPECISYMLLYIVRQGLADGVSWPFSNCEINYLHYYTGGAYLTTISGWHMSTKFEIRA